jgi:hypothetical protein
MKRSFQCAFGMAALFVSSSACAQTFGNKGQLAISAERLFGFYHDSQTVSLGAPVGDQTTKYDSFSFLSSGLGAGFYAAPRVAGDYFIIDHLSIGGALGYSHVSVSNPAINGTTTSVGTDSFLFAARAGWAYMFTDIIGIWPRGGFTYRTLNPGATSGHVLAFTAEVPVVFTVIPHVAFWAGPTLDLGITGSRSQTVGAATVSQDINATEIGIQTGMTAYFDL